MKKWMHQILLAGVLIALSGAFYTLHYRLFHDAHHIFVYLVGDIAFVFIEVLLVTVIIHRLLGEHERHAQREKLNMIIGIFYSEVGTHLLKLISLHDPQTEKFQQQLIPHKESPPTTFLHLCTTLKTHHFELNTADLEWDAILELLRSKKDFLVRLLENTTLHEHQSFTDILRSVFHLTEELAARKTLRDMPDVDRKHLDSDLRRVYGQLATQWVDYMKDLEKNYPHLFSFALRMNPFDQTASPVVQ